MAINFPSNPSVNDTHTVNGRTYIWTGEKWRRRRPRIEYTPPTMDVSNDFSAGGALHVDSSTGRIGIGTSTPATDLHVDGNVEFTGTLDVTGLITSATATAVTNDTTVATTAYVQTALAGLVDSAPSTLDTLNELAAALGDDPNFATTITNSIATKQDASTALTTSTTFGGDVSGTYNAIVVANDSHSHSTYLPLSGGTVTGQLTLGTSASIRQSSSTWTGNPGSGVGKIEYHSNRWYIVAGSNSTELLRVRRDGTDKFVIDNNGSISVGSVPWARLTGVPSYVSTANNSTLNSDSRNTRGPTRLYRRDSNSNYSVQTYWTGARWRLYGYSGDSNHADTHVGYADSAGNADTVDGYHASSFHINSYGNDVTCDSTYADNWLRPTGSSGLYFESRGGGWYMTDTTWIRAYNNKWVYTNGGAFRAYKSGSTTVWSDGPLQSNSNGYNGWGHQCASSNTHTGQWRPASGTWYARNYNDGSYWTVAAYISNQSSGRYKQDVETWGTAKPLSSAVNITYDTTATDLIKQLRPVSYRLKKHERLVRHIPEERRRQALDRLNTIKIKSGEEQYSGEEAVHQCGRDCDGSPESPCFMYQNWDRGTIGFIAEEVGEVIPEATDMNLKPDAPHQGENGAIDGLAMTAVLTKAFQEMEARIAELESRLA